MQNNTNPPTTPGTGATQTAPVAPTQSMAVPGTGSHQQPAPSPVSQGQPPAQPPAQPPQPKTQASAQPPLGPTQTVAITAPAIISPAKEPTRQWRYAPKSPGASHFLNSPAGLRRARAGEVVELTKTQEVALADRFEPMFVPTDDDREEWKRIREGGVFIP